MGQLLKFNTEIEDPSKAAIACQKAISINYFLFISNLLLRIRP